MAHDGSDDSQYDDILSWLTEALAAAVAETPADMAHDGSQYDIKGPWDQDYLLLRLEEALAGLEASETPAEKAPWRDVVADHKHDLYVLHGIDI